jgi:hypothetical protein
MLIACVFLDIIYVFQKSEKTEDSIVKAVFLVALLMLVIFCILRMRGKILERSVYADEFAEIKVKEIQLRPFSLNGLLGIGGKLYRCEFRKSPGGILESAISLHEDSYEAQQIEVSWYSARKATVSFDGAIFYEIEDGIWKKTSNPFSNDK